jgi:competence protein ComEC
VLTISGQHVAVLAAVVYFTLRAFAVPAATRTLTTLGLIWLYITVAGAPPSAIRAPRSSSPLAYSDARSRPCDVRSYDHRKVRFCATVGEEVEIEVV